MTDRRGGSGFSWEPQRVGGQGTERGRGRRNLVAVLIVLVALAVVGFALFGERLTRRPNLDLSFLPTPAPTPSPSASTRPVGPTPSATDLPRITRGDEIRSGAVPFISDGFRLLDMVSGDITIGPGTAMGRDVVFPAPSGSGWLCICADDDVTTGATRTSFQLVQIEPDGTTGPVLDGDGRAFIVNSDGYVFNTVALTSDRSKGLIAVAAGTGVDWRISVATLDAAAGTIGPYTDLTPPERPATSPTPSFDPAQYGVSWEPPRVAMAPDGRSALVWHAASATSGRNTIVRRQEWRLTLAPDGTVTDIGPATAVADIPLFCQAVFMTRSDEVLSACPLLQLEPDGAPVPPGMSVRLASVDGGTTRELTVPLEGSAWTAEPLIDGANRAVYVWTASATTVSRVDLDTMHVTTVAYEPAAQRAPGVAAGANRRAPDWITDGLVGDGRYRLLTPSPDGSRLFAIGLGESRSSQAAGPMVHGIFVIDRTTLALLDRWAPAAGYLSLSMLADGRSLALSGTPWTDAQGIQRDWQGSLTIHDIDDGRIVARYGQLGQGMPPLVVPP